MRADDPAYAAGITSHDRVVSTSRHLHECYSHIQSATAAAFGTLIVSSCAGERYANRTSQNFMPLATPQTKLPQRLCQAVPIIVVGWSYTGGASLLAAPRPPETLHLLGSSLRSRAVWLGTPQTTGRTAHLLQHWSINVHTSGRKCLSFCCNWCCVGLKLSHDY